MTGCKVDAFELVEEANGVDAGRAGVPLAPEFAINEGVGVAKSEGTVGVDGEKADEPGVGLDVEPVIQFWFIVLLCMGLD